MTVERQRFSNLWRKYFDRGDTPVKVVLIYLALLAHAFISFYPILNVFAVSLRPHQELFSSSLAVIPPGATWDNYRAALFDRPLLLWVRNSLKVSILTAVLCIALGGPAAYAFSRWRFRGRRAGLGFMLAAQMFPAPMLLLPTFLVLRNLGLVNTHAGLIIPYVATALPFVTWMLKGYYEAIPRELEESAYLDGATPFSALVRIVFPLALPAVAVSALFAFMTAWAEYVVARVILTKPHLYTLPIGLVSLQTQFSAEWGVYSAAAILTSVPVIVVFVLLSRYLIGGLTSGGLKG